MANSVVKNECAHNFGCLPSFQPMGKDDTQWFDGFWGSNLPSIVQLSGMVDAVNSIQGPQDTPGFSSSGSDSSAIAGIDFQKLAQSSPLQSFFSTMIVNNNAGTVTDKFYDGSKSQNKDRHDLATPYCFDTDSGPENLIAGFANQKCDNFTFNDSTASPLCIRMIQEPEKKMSGITTCFVDSDETYSVGTRPPINASDTFQGGFDFAAFLAKEADVLAKLARDASLDSSGFVAGISDAIVITSSAATVLTDLTPSTGLPGQENYSSTDSIHAAAEGTKNKGDANLVGIANHSSAFATAIISLDGTKPDAAVSSASMRVLSKRALEPNSKKCKGPHDHGKLASRFRGVTRHRWDF